MPTNTIVQYNIPRVQVQLPARQNRLTGGSFTITPSMTEPVKFIFGNMDGVPLNLLPFKVRFVVWERNVSQSDTVSSGQSTMVINKTLQIDDPYSGEAEMVLSEAETMAIGNHAAGSQLSWSLFMINDEGQVFPLQVSNSGGRYGTIHVDLMAGTPFAELIRTPKG